MTVHTDTNRLQKYIEGSYPTIDGREPQFIINELSRISKTLNTIVDVMKLFEARMNTNGLT